MFISFGNARWKIEIGDQKGKITKKQMVWFSLLDLEVGRLG